MGKYDDFKNAFNQINMARNTTRTTISALSLWPELVPNTLQTINTNEYWNMADILNITKPDNNAYFQSPIGLETILTQNTPWKLINRTPINLTPDHVLYSINNIELSRYACWTLCKEIEHNRKTTFFQEYFLNPNATFDTIMAHTLQSTRIPLRNRASTLNTQLNGILNSLGPNKEQFANFNREKMEWLFNNRPKAHVIKTCKLMPNIKKPKPNTYAIPSRTNLLDYMGVNLLIAYINAMQKIITQWDSTNPKSRCYTTLRDITYNAIKSIPTISTTQMCQTGTNTIMAIQQARESEFAKKYINEKIR